MSVISKLLDEYTQLIWGTMIGIYVIDPLMGFGKVKNFIGWCFVVPWIVWRSWRYFIFSRNLPLFIKELAKLYLKKYDFNNTSEGIVLALKQSIEGSELPENKKTEFVKKTETNDLGKSIREIPNTICQTLTIYPIYCSWWWVKERQKLQLIKFLGAHRYSQCKSALGIEVLDTIHQSLSQEEVQKLHCILLDSGHSASTVQDQFNVDLRHTMARRGLSETFGDLIAQVALMIDAEREDE